MCHIQSTAGLDFQVKVLKTFAFWYKSLKRFFSVQSPENGWRGNGPAGAAIAAERNRVPRALGPVRYKPLQQLHNLCPVAEAGRTYLTQCIE